LRPNGMNRPLPPTVTRPWPDPSQAASRPWHAPCT
jgi:hypothetical protein